MKILVIEDNEDILDLFRLVFSEFKEDEIIYSNRALDEVYYHNVDVALLDYVLGSGTDGGEIARDIKIYSPNCFIILSSAHGPLYEYDPNVNRFVDELVPKPPSVNYLVSLIYKAKNQRQGL